MGCCSLRVSEYFKILHVGFIFYFYVPEAFASQVVLPLSPLQFPSYGVFRDLLLESVQKARTRVLVVTPQIFDGDVASALFSAKLRGLNVRVVLDPKKSRGYLSRHTYLMENNVEISMTPLVNSNRNWKTLLVVDDGVWAVSASLAPKHKGGVNFSPAALPPEDVAQWFSEALSNPVKFAPIPLAGAKKPTSAPASRIPSGTIGRGERVIRRKFVDRGLPRTTRGSLVEAGLLQPETVVPGGNRGSVPTRKPDVSDRESTLPE